MNQSVQLLKFPITVLTFKLLIQAAIEQIRKCIFCVRYSNRVTLAYKKNLKPSGRETEEMARYLKYQNISEISIVSISYF